MKKLVVKDLVEFRKKSDRGKKSFVEKLKLPKKKSSSEGGGDYWIPSLSAVCNAYKADNLKIIDDKLSELENKLTTARTKISKDMYKRNIEILEGYKIIHRRGLRPKGKLAFLQKSTITQLLTIRGLEVRSRLSHIFTLGMKNASVGGVWFVAKIQGYSIEEMGLFCELLNRVLKHNYSRKYSVDSKHCLAVDLISGQAVSYEEIERGVVPKLLAPTLDEVKRYL